MRILQTTTPPWTTETNLVIGASAYLPDFPDASPDRPPMTLLPIMVPAFPANDQGPPSRCRQSPRSGRDASLEQGTKRMTRG